MPLESDKLTFHYHEKEVEVDWYFPADERFAYRRQPVGYLRLRFVSGARLHITYAVVGGLRVLPQFGYDLIDQTKGERLIVFSRPGHWVIERPNQSRILVAVDPPAVQPDGSLRRGVGAWGIQPDGEEVLTDRINQAIAEVSQEGGGTLVFPAGIYRTGTICFHSNVTLHLERGAVLQATTDPGDFPPEPEEAICRDVPKSLIPGARRRLILMENVENAAIEGDGTIDGQGSEWRRLFTKPRIMVNLIRLVACRNIRIEGITLLDSEFWSTHLLHCQDMVFRRVKWLNEIPPKGWDRFKKPDSESVWNNADGLNPDSSQNVLVEDCLFHTGDDCVPVKNTGTWYGRLADVRDITVRRCVMISSVTAMKIGTETRGERIGKILFEDCDIVSCSRAFAADLKDGAKVSNITFRNITVHHCNRPFDFWILEREKQKDQRIFSRLSDVLLERIDFVRLRTEGSGFTAHVQGRSPEADISGLTFKAVTMEGRPFLGWEDFEVEINEWVRQVCFG
ncbi:MAG: hypothetical protein JJT75_09990 [Opitutales bacterium]|nr:hypothetical protein [Opitutales bacterium]